MKIKFNKNTSVSMAPVHISDIAQMWELLQKLHLNIGECVGRESLAIFVPNFRGSRTIDVQYVLICRQNEVSFPTFVFLLLYSMGACLRCL